MLSLRIWGCLAVLFCTAARAMDYGAPEKPLVEPGAGRLNNNFSSLGSAAALSWSAGANRPAAVSASAQEEYQAQEVVVRGRASNLVGIADSASQGKISQEDLSRRPLLRPAEVLEAVPGLLITQHSGDGKANQYFTRGFNLDHGTDFAFNVDGVPINMVSHAHAEGYTDLNFLIPDLVQEVDYHKGPYSVEQGDFATAGSANFEYPYVLKQNLALLTLGEWGYQRGLLAGSQALGPGHLLYALELGNYDGPWDTPEAFKKFNGLLRYSQGDLQNGFSLTASGYQANWNATNQMPQRAFEEGLINFFGNLSPTDGGNTRRSSLWAQWQRSTQEVQSQIVAYCTLYHMQLWNDFTFFLNDPVHGDQFEQEDERTLSGLRGHHIFKSSLFGLPWQNELGLDARNDNVTTLGLYSTQARQRLQTEQLNHVVESSVGPYYSTTLQCLPSLRAELGFRQDFYHMQVLGSDSATTGQADASIPQPKAKLAWKPWQHLEFYADYGWGFHSNDARIITPNGLANLSGQVGASPLVQAKGLEAGARFGWQDVVESTVALWQLHLDSELTFNGDQASSAVSNPSTRQGLEWSNSLHLHPFFMDFDYAYSQARFDSLDTLDDPSHPGYFVPEALEQVWSATLGSDPFCGWSADFRLRYFGSRALTPDDSVRSNADLEVSARLAYQVSANGTINLDIFNLLDERDYDVSYYYASRLPGEPLGGVEDIHGHPMEPRSVRVSWVDRF